MLFNMYLDCLRSFLNILVMSYSGFESRPRHVASIRRVTRPRRPEVTREAQERGSRVTEAALSECLFKSDIELPNLMLDQLPQHRFIAT